MSIKKSLKLANKKKIDLGGKLVYGVAMKQPTFNKVFPILWATAQSQGLNKRQYMKRCGLGNQRWAEFAVAAGMQIPRSGTKESRARDISAKYIRLLAGGLGGLTMDDVEKKYGKKFTQAQREALSLDAWFRANEDTLRQMKDKPHIWKMCLALLEAYP